MRLSGVIAVAALTAISAATAHGRLVQQKVEGAERVCLYERDGPVSTEQEAVKVGLGELCPDTRPFGDEQVREAPVPFMAQLRVSRIREGRRICVYALAGRDYERTVPVTTRCPITPYF